MERFVIGPAAVIPVNHLAHEPEIPLELSGHPAHLLHKTKVQAVSAVQADAVDVKFLYPEADHIKQVILHSLIPEV